MCENHFCKQTNENVFWLAHGQSKVSAVVMYEERAHGKEDRIYVRQGECQLHAPI